MIMLPRLDLTASGRELISERRVQRALRHVSDYWLPVNPRLLTKIQNGIKEGAYELDPDFLITDLKTDVGLFWHCVRHAAQLYRVDPTRSPTRPSPIDLLRWAGIGKLKKTLEQDAREISSHVLSVEAQHQAAFIYNALVSASTTEILAEKADNNGQLGFCVSMIRQLGLLLVAFNYPGVCERAIQATRSSVNSDFEAILGELLGFHPRTLALALVDEWGLGDELVHAVGEGYVEWSHPEALKKSRVSQLGALKKLVEVGEALARANDPAHFPSAAEDWKAVQADLAGHLGADGLRQIQHAVKGYTAAYSALVPDLFGDAVVQLDPESRLRQIQEDRLFSKNPHLRVMPPQLRKQFRELYSQLDNKQIHKHLLTKLVRELVPSCGFLGGCVFTIDPLTNALVPRLKFGELRHLKPGPVSITTETPGDLVGAAYHCSTPLVEERHEEEGSDLRIMCSHLGSQKKLGVIYLEGPPGGELDSSTDPLVRFKAVRQALQDCLTIA